MVVSSCSLTVVMPVFNEDGVIVDVLDAVRREVLDSVPGSELVVVDDASTDGTAALLAAAAAGDPRVRVLTNSTNLGHGASVRRGLNEAGGEWVLQVDSDGQVDLREFATFWAARDDFDLLMGVRVVRRDPVHRVFLTRATRLVVSALARRSLRDANVPFKLIRADLVHHLLSHMPPDAFAPSIMLALGASRSGARVAEFEITHLPRPHGRSTLRVGRLVRACARSGWQTLRFGLRRIEPYR